jgi:hypothetical protein
MGTRGQFGLLLSDFIIDKSKGQLNREKQSKMPVSADFDRPIFAVGLCPEKKKGLSKQAFY